VNALRAKSRISSPGRSIVLRVEASLSTSRRCKNDTFAGLPRPVPVIALTESHGRLQWRQNLSTSFQSGAGMAGSSVIRAAIFALWLLASCFTASVADAADAPSGGDPVRVETGPSTGISVRLGEELAGLAADGTTQRVVPVVGRGGVQNIADLLAGRGIDMAFVQLDALDYARTQKLFPNLESRTSYVAKLNYVEFHLLARADVTSVNSLTGKVVDVGAATGGSAITTTQLFRLLKISFIPSNDDPALAIDRLRRGEIAAVAFVAGKPAPLLRLGNTEGLHLVPIPLTTDVIGAYVPSRLNATDYPGLVSRDAPVDTVAVGTGLFVGPLAPGTDQYRRVSNLVDTLFTQFQALLAPGRHEKWSEVNLSSQIPGWQRFPAADDWLRRNAAVSESDDMRMVFMKFLEERAKVTGGQQLSQQQKDALFDQFRHWQSGPAQNGPGQNGQSGQNN
jgi:TRAP-type uncharacterized transport system substrate-binding protein